MQPAAILEELRSPQDRIPEEALLAAMDQPAALVPGLLDLLRETVEDAPAHLEDTGFIFALYLLAQFREPRALPLLQALLRLPEDQQDALFGDLLTEGVPSILASLAAHDPSQLEIMAADQDLDIFVRTAAMDALLALGFQGVVSELALQDSFDTLLTLFEARGAKETPEAWAFLAGACATAGFASFLERLRAAQARGWVDASITDPEGMEAALTSNPAHARRRFLKSHHPVEDAILDLEDQGWFTATDEEEEEEEEGEEITIPTLAPGALQTILARQGHASPRTGPSRNSPCPCGSGKKYKRCCGKD